MSNIRAKASKMTAVAERAGVSLSTVSRALSGSPLISDKTRRAVEKAAASLDYRVDAAGSSLRTGLTRTVGLVIPLAHAEKQKLSDPFFLEMIGAIADELSAIGYSLLLSKVTDDPADWITAAVRERRVDGILIIGQSLHHETINKLAALDIPLVVWGARRKNQRYLTVGADNKLGGEIATSHLLEQGCRDIVFLGDPAVPEVAARLNGYREALSAGGVKRRPALEVPVRFGGDAAYRAIASRLARKLRFDGVFACSDVFAMSAMRALTEHGFEVPADVAVVGFDDIPFAEFTSPPLTTVRQDYHAGARALVANLLRRLRREPAESVIVPTELVVRGSSLRPKRAQPSPGRVAKQPAPSSQQ
jgi:DNA-binding LacI/PurR family transcriptional regulator